ncbi:MAG TPA: hypothetical protein VJ912_01390 [Candidatus Nanoarchaeia archaeon]|nr:hypothetical protein [Candidatus Nanoarchaeia archaeon]
MEKLVLDKPARIIKNRKTLEEELDVKISQRGRELFIEGEGKDKHIGKKVLQAIDFGFNVDDALLLSGEEDYKFEKINIKSISKAKDMQKVRGLIIGKGGKALSTLSKLTNCIIQMNGNKIGIIGLPEWTDIAREGIRQLALGIKHSTVYSYLEKHQPEPVLDLGLKEGFKDKDIKELRESRKEKEELRENFENKEK